MEYFKKKELNKVAEEFLNKFSELYIKEEPYSVKPIKTLSLNNGKELELKDINNNVISLSIKDEKSYHRIDFNTDSKGKIKSVNKMSNDTQENIDLLRSQIRAIDSEMATKFRKNLTGVIN